jgi:hypothetical protein
MTGRCLAEQCRLAGWRNAISRPLSRPPPPYLRPTRGRMPAILVALMGRRPLLLLGLFVSQWLMRRQRDRTARPEEVGRHLERRGRATMRPRQAELLPAYRGGGESNPAAADAIYSSPSTPSAARAASTAFTPAAFPRFT